MSSPQAETPRAEQKQEIKPRVVAAVDIGATAIRMVIAEIDRDGAIRVLESLRQGVELGRDTFNTGAISQGSMRECVEILKGYKLVMNEFGLTDPAQVRAVATSSVREARNGDSFVDRIYVGTGIPVKIVDEAEENRLTYMAVYDSIRSDPALADGNALVVEVGGGSTELILVQKGHVAYSNSYRLGALRMRETLEMSRTPREKMRNILSQHIERTIEQMFRDVPKTEHPVLVAMAGDARFAAEQLVPNWKDVPMARLDVKTFSTFAEKIVTVPVDRLVQKYKISYQEGETAGPALLAYSRLAATFGIEEVVIPKVTLRHGMLKELSMGGAWTEAMSDEVVGAAMALGKRYEFDRKHATHVASLCVKMFRNLSPEHHLDKRYELLLRLAALLHDVGEYVNARSHHKHSLYLILNSDLFGLTRQETQIVALTARYHRRATPSSSHPEFAVLDRDERLVVAKMASILRVADAMDRNHSQQVKDVAFARENNQFIVTVNNVEDLTVERLAVKEKQDLFEEIYGMSVAVSEGRLTGGPQVG